MDFKARKLCWHITSVSLRLICDVRSLRILVYPFHLRLYPLLRIVGRGDNMIVRLMVTGRSAPIIGFIFIPYNHIIYHLRPWQNLVNLLTISQT